MMLLLTLFCAGCSSSRQSILASVHQGPLGNAVLVTLPPGTRIHLPNDSDAAFVRAALVNEVEPGGETLVTRRPLKLATPAYIAERDARELELIRRTK